MTQEPGSSGDKGLGDSELPEWNDMEANWLPARPSPGGDMVADDLSSVSSSACAASPECSKHGRRGLMRLLCHCGRRDEELEESEPPGVDRL